MVARGRAGRFPLGTPQREGDPTALEPFQKIVTTIGRGCLVDRTQSVRRAGGKKSKVLLRVFSGMSVFMVTACLCGRPRPTPRRTLTARVSKLQRPVC
jgi:hypothetical protein